MNFNPWTGRAGETPGDKFFHRVSQEPGGDFALIGFATHEGVRRNQGRIGAQEGPAALRKALAGLSVHRDYRVTDLGDIPCPEGGDLEAAQKTLAEVVAQAKTQGSTTVVLGGGHESAYGHFLGLLNSLAPGERLGIINIDAHWDLRSYETEGVHSGSGFLQMAHELQRRGQVFDYTVIGLEPLSNTRTLFQRAAQLGARFVPSDEKPDILENVVTQCLDRNTRVYLSICLDAFSSASAPGVSAPQPLGLDPRSVLPILNNLARSQKLMGWDMVELCPPLDPGGMTAKLGAYLCGLLMERF